MLTLHVFTNTQSKGLSHSVISVIFLIFVTQTFMIFHVSLDINAPSLWDPATVQDGSDWSFSTWGYVLKMPFWMLAHWIFVQLSIQQSQCGFCPSIQQILEESSSDFFSSTILLLEGILYRWGNLLICLWWVRRCTERKLQTGKGPKGIGFWRVEENIGKTW